MMNEYRSKVTTAEKALQAVRSGQIGRAHV